MKFDPWLPHHIDLKNVSLPQNISKVCDLLIGNLPLWNISLIQNLFPRNMLNQILQVSLRTNPNSGWKDTKTWSISTKGVFSTKSA